MKIEKFACVVYGHQFTGGRNLRYVSSGLRLVDHAGFGPEALQSLSIVLCRGAATVDYLTAKSKKAKKKEKALLSEIKRLKTAVEEE